MSDANRIALRYVEESTYGTTPTGSGTDAMQEVRFTSEGLKQESGSAESEEIRDDRQTADVKRLSVGASGPINFELTYGSFDDFLKAALMSAGWSTAITVGPVSTISFVQSGSYIRGANGAFASFAAYQWIKVSGATNAGNNNYFQITEVGDYGSGNSDNQLTIQGGTLTDESAGQSITIVMGAQVTNGVTETSYSIEKEYKDLSNIFSILTGMMINTMEMSIESEAIINGNFGFLGKDETSAAATACVGSAVAVNSNPVMNGVDDVSKVLENMSSKQIISGSFSLNNNLRQQTVVGTLGPIGIGTGSISISGTLRAYFTTVTALDKFLNQTSTNLAFVMEDTDGNAYIIDFPEVKFTDGARVAESKDSDIVEDLTWSAYRDSTQDVTIRVVRFAA